MVATKLASILESVVQEWVALLSAARSGPEGTDLLRLAGIATVRPVTVGIAMGLLVTVGIAMGLPVTAGTVMDLLASAGIVVMELLALEGTATGLRVSAGTATGLRVSAGIVTDLLALAETVMDLTAAIGRVRATEVSKNKRVKDHLTTLSPFTLTNFLFKNAAEPPRERQKLSLKPRSVPLDESPAAQPSAPAPVAAEAEPSPSTASSGGGAKAAIFGLAKPVDTAAREREIEERLKERQKEREAPRGREISRPE